MKDYLLLLRGGHSKLSEMSEEDVNEHMGQWKQYMGDLSQRGHLVGGLPLQQDGRIVTTNGTTEEVVRSAAGETVDGWLHFKANDYIQAVELAKDCPIFEHNGNIEVREIMPMEM